MDAVIEREKEAIIAVGLSWCVQALMTMVSTGRMTDDDTKFAFI